MRSRIAILLFFVTFPAVVLAEARAPRRAPGDGFRTEFLANLADTEQKLVNLAEATPAEKYTWRPGPGVRSISEVYMHIAQSNYFLATFVGIPAPKSSGGDPEKSVTKKAEVIAELKRSFEYLRSVPPKVADLEKPVKMFGTQTTHRGVLLTILTHCHEHLGQQIAYARMNGVVPPWSH